MMATIHELAESLQAISRTLRVDGYPDESIAIREVADYLIERQAIEVPLLDRLGLTQEQWREAAR